MNLWVALILSIILMQSFQCCCGLTKRKRRDNRALLKDVEELKNFSESEEYKKSEYQKGNTRLYTARMDDHTDTCTQQILDCYYEELKVVVEELSLFGEDNLAKEMDHLLDNIKSYEKDSNMVDSCKKCEEYEEKSFDDFLKNFLFIAQKINAETKKPPY